MCLLSAVLSFFMAIITTLLFFFLPGIGTAIGAIAGTLIGGFVGGRKAGNFLNASLAALISAILIGGVTYLAVDFIVSFVEGLPLIGFLIESSGIGDMVRTGAVILALIHAMPTLLMGILGGATAKNQD